MTNMGCSVSATQVWLQRFRSSFQPLQIDRPEHHFYHDVDNDDSDGDNVDFEDDGVDDVNNDEDTC